jgi:YegS/Rv2252/BmrU family lipid kinase
VAQIKVNPILIVNQESGKVPSKMAELRKLSKQHKLKLHMCEGSDLDHEIREALKDSTLNRIIIGGGDGSVNTAVSLVLKKKQNVSIGVLPLGTANYYAKSLGISKKLSHAFEVALGDHAVKRHVCTANGREFLIGVNVGSASRMFAEVTDEEKQRFGRLAYFRGVFRTLRTAMPPDVTVRANGRTKKYASTELVVLNQHVDEAIKLMPKVDGSKPYFEIITYGLGNSKFSPILAVAIFALTFGRNQKYLTRIRATEAIITSKTNLPVAVDGDILEKLPLEIKLVDDPVYFMSAT